MPLLLTLLHFWRATKICGIFILAGLKARFFEYFYKVAAAYHPRPFAGIAVGGLIATVPE
jgi:hypothetical protein